MPRNQKKKMEECTEDHKILQGESEQKLSYFCECGIGYKGLRQLHQHIKRKHPHEKQRYKASYVNLSKRQKQKEAKQARFCGSYVDVDQEETTFLDLTAWTMLEIAEQFQKKYQKFQMFRTIDQEDSSDEDEDQDEIVIHSYIEKVFQQSRQMMNQNYFKPGQQYQDMIDEEQEARQAKGEIRKDKIEDQIIKISKGNQIANWNIKLKNKQVLQFISLKRYKWNMFESLSRFFSISFAARIELSLKLIYIFNNLKLKEEEQYYLEEDIKKLWTNDPEIIQILSQYCQQWLKLMPKTK